MRTIIRNICATLLAALFVMPVYAVTDKEMDEARAIAARLYLRWSNDASGYLDDVKPKSMSDLQSQLKAKEKENLKAFSAVKVPADYRSWDKRKLVEYWSVTAFDTPGLSQAGKRAKDRVRKQLEKMNVSAPVKEAPAPAAAPAGQQTPVAAAPVSAAPSADTVARALTAEQPADAEAAEIEKEEKILADQNAIAAAAETGQPRKSSGTWVYVVILVVLVAVVIGLMVFAARIMKKEPGILTSGANSGDNGNADFEKTLRKKDEEILRLSALLDESEEKAASLASANEELRRANGRLEAELAMARSSAADYGVGSESRQSRPAATGGVARRPESQPESETVVRRSAPQPAEPAQQKVLNVVYLGRVNARGLFVRGDRRPSPGNTVFRLDTRDGLVGTFRLADDPSAADLAFSDPATYLAGGCTGNFEDAPVAERIITENSGTAIFENNCWKVLRKSRVRFE